MDHSMHEGMGGHEGTGSTMAPMGGGGGHEGHGSGMDMDMGMKMFFHTGYTETILFKEWKTTSIEGMVGSCIGIFIIAAIYEGLKVLRTNLQTRYSQAHASFSSISSNGQQTNNDSTTVMVSPGAQQKHLFCQWPHLLQSFLHLVQMFISYCLMLIFMTYNVWLCLSVIVGAATGHLLFGWRQAVVVYLDEHCH